MPTNVEAHESESDVPAFKGSSQQSATEKEKVASSRWSVAKDFAGTLQNCCAVLAFLSAIVWFWAQAPFRPVIKWTVVSNVMQDANGQRLNAELTVENNGHIPFRYRCQGLTLSESPTASTSGLCGQKAETLAPGEQIVFGQVFSINNPAVPKTVYLKARIGDVAIGSGIWTEGSSGTTKVVFLSPPVSKPKSIAHKGQSGASTSREVGDDTGPPLVFTVKPQYRKPLPPRHHGPPVNTTAQ